MSAFFTDGVYTSPVVIGPARISFPFSGDSATKIIEQDFMVKFSSFSALALNTAHATYTDAYLVGESPLQAVGGGLATWTRTYAQKPAQRNEYESFAYQFIGYLGDQLPPYDTWPGTGEQRGRDPFTKKVLSRIQHDYFRIFPSGGDYTDVSSIPFVYAQTYIADETNERQVRYLTDTTLNPVAGETIPSQEDYKDLVTNGDEIVAEDCDIRRWMGNIYERVTRYVVAL